MKFLILLLTFSMSSGVIAAKETPKNCFDSTEEKLIATKPTVVKRVTSKVSSLVFKLGNGKELTLKDSLPRCEDSETMRHYTLSELSSDGRWAIVESRGWEIMSRQLINLENGRSIGLEEDDGTAWSNESSKVFIYREDTCSEKDTECSKGHRGELYDCTGNDCKRVWNMDTQSTHLLSPGDVLKGVSVAVWNKYSISMTMIVLRGKTKIELSLICGLYMENAWGCARDD